MNGPPTSVGECFLCSRLGTCAQTSVGKVVAGYTCPLYDPANDALAYARFLMVDRYNFLPALRAMLGNIVEEDLNQMSTVYEQPPVGTTVSQRLAMFDQWGFPNVRLLGVHRYKCLEWNETLAQTAREVCRKKVIDYELAKGIIVPDQQPDAAPQTPQGETQMAQPFQPGVVQPPQTSQPAIPAPPPMPVPPPVGPPPMAPPAFAVPAPPAMAAPAAVQPPPMAPPAMVAPPPSGRGKGKVAGAVAAPPPPPPPPMVPQPPGAVTAPSQGWAPPAFAPQFQPPVNPVPQPVPPQQPVVGADLGPVLSQVDAVGRAVNNLAAATEKAFAELRQTQALLTVAMYHLYASDAALTDTAKRLGWDLASYEKFLAHLNNNLPR